MKVKSLVRIGLVFSGIISFLILHSCTSTPGTGELQVSLSNPGEVAIKDAVIGLDNPDFLKKLTKDSELKLGDKVIPSQQVDADKDGITDMLLILCDLDAKASAQLVVRDNPGEKAEFVKRTQAEVSVKEGGEWVKIVNKDTGEEKYEYSEGSFKNISYLRVPDEHSDHSYYIRYEGPGWESDKVGYRFYLDWRNATDIFGKKVPDMVLQNVGQDGFESYHEPAGWGMDVLKVGSSLGIGSMAYWTGKEAVRVENTDSIVCEILENGDLRSSIETIYYGWSDPDKTTDLRSVHTINAGSRLTHVQLSVNDGIDNVCTGIVKHEEAEIIQDGGEGSNWAYLATFGKQSLNNDNLGMVVFYKKGDLLSLTEDEQSHVLVLSLSDNSVGYYFGAVWEPDVDQISTREGFTEYLDATLQRLNNPIEISY